MSHQSGIVEHSSSPKPVSQADILFSTIHTHTCLSYIPASPLEFFFRCGLLSYGVLSLICKRVFHNPLAEALLATEVSPEMHDRSTFIFLTAMSLDLLNVFFERNTVKLDFVLLPTFIKLVACTTNVIVQARFPVLCISHAGRL